MQTLRAFLLTRHWRDTPKGLEISLWATTDAGPLRILLNQEDAVFFIPGSTQAIEGGCKRRSLTLSTFAGVDVDGLYFRRQSDLIEMRSKLQGLGIETFESDIKPVDRFLMERFITAGFAARGRTVRRNGYLEMRNPAVRKDDYRRPPTRVSLDIETEGLDGALYSVALSSKADERVLMVSDKPVHCDDVKVEVFIDERELLHRLFAWFAEHDPDMIIGWSVVAFDLDFIARRCERLSIPFDLARGGERSVVLRPGDRSALHIARIPGRVVLDGIESLRGAFWSFESFDLESVARALLGKGKRIDQVEDRVSKISHLYRHDRPRLAAYNIEDCRLVDAIFERTDLVEFSMRRAELTGLGMDRYGGSVAAFDNLYLPRLHRAGRVAPDAAGAPVGESPGGYVLDSKPGIYDNVLVLDFKSLYPSIIRTFGIDPYALHAPGEDRIEGFAGASFARKGAILPGIVQDLWDERDRAKAKGDGAMSQATKILMNSFYGILGAAGCRFRDTRLASSITRRGHEIIRRTRDAIEGEGLNVIYGDTDSLFVLLGSQVSEEKAGVCGSRLSSKLNEKWKRSIRQEHGLECHLEIEFETHFLKFLMPTVRGDVAGSKKRYAGLIRNAEGEYELIFKGLESVRTDWTPLARSFQRELYRRVFIGEPFEDYIRSIAEEMLQGLHDESLVYRKRLRRRLSEYTRNAPPHVQAARKLGTEKRLRHVRYIVTSNGPEPVRPGHPLPRPDYEHYRSRQLAPAADGVLHFLDTSFEAITDRQMAIFD
ncbi:DNA polymerase II [Thioalkalivibrio sp. HK1]|uniref:DNA polymerase II n=1 Tax=Thioalkalivibrio sp. HK1 TaxID=1469245 RepID=UPI000470CE4D|nr:DNA polymerase II [Thioalkalivibrio sp. HK1]